MQYTTAAAAGRRLAFPLHLPANWIGNRTDGRTGGRTNGRTDGRTDERTNRRANGRTDERTDGRTGGRTDRRTGGRTDGRTGGRTDRQTGERTDEPSSAAGGRPLIFCASKRKPLLTAISSNCRRRFRSRKHRLSKSERDSDEMQLFRPGLEYGSVRPLERTAGRVTAATYNR